MRALVVDDDATSRRLLRRLLAPFGECDVAVNGWEALEAFKCAHAGNHPYDLICLDIMMPDLDGHDALNKIRRHEAKSGIDEKDQVKVIVTTVVADREHVLAAAQRKCSAYLVKPIDRERLLKELRRLGLILE